MPEHGAVVDWLLDPLVPAVRAAALVRLLGRDPGGPEVVEARAAAMRADPIRAILAAQDPAGWWVKTGPGYAPKYTGTVWQLIFLDQLGADPVDPGVQRACDHVLAWCSAVGGGFGMSGRADRPAPAGTVAHCLNGNLLAALVGFGRLDDPRVAGAAEWAASAATGEDHGRWYASATCGPGFACASNDHQPCAWGAVKALRGLARVPADRRSPGVEAALDAGAEFLLSRDPAVADYPMGFGNTRPSGTWFKLGFPAGYTADVLSVLEVLAALGRGGDPRLAHAREWLRAQRGPDGRWRNRNALNGKTTVDVERQGDPSRWVTLRALAVLGAA